MKKLFFILFFSTFFNYAFSNIQFIDFSKIPLAKSNQKDIQWISDNFDKLETWTPQWEFKTSKESISSTLEKIYNRFTELSDKNPKNLEIFLLLGSIAHYLHNLDVPDFYDKGVINYEKALALDSMEMRGHWFLGFHLCEATNGHLGMPHFQKALTLISNDSIPLQFYYDLGYSAYVSGMLSHARFAYDRIRDFTKDSSELEKLLNKVISKQLIKPSPDSTYNNEKVWNAFESNKLEFSSQMLGLRFSINPNWKMQLFGFENRKGGFLLTPNEEKGINESTVTYTIGVFAKIPNENETLIEFAAKLCPFVSGENEWKYSEEIPGLISREIFDSTLYSEQGGAHMIMLAFERPCPQYPGFKTEFPLVLPNKGNANSMSFYKANPQLTRFSGTIYYFIILDSCNSIFKKSKSVFDSFLENNLVVE